MKEGDATAAWEGGREGGREEGRGREEDWYYWVRGTAVMKVFLSMQPKEEGERKGERKGGREGRRGEGGKQEGREGEKRPNDLCTSDAPRGRKAGFE